MAAIDYAVLYDYATWANDRLLAEADRLTPAQWDQPLGASFDTVHATLAHILSSEDLWLERWRGSSLRARRVTPEQCPTPAALRARWATVAHDMRRFLAACTQDDWQREIAYITLEGQAVRYPLWMMFLQVINHGTHHRAEVANMLTELGSPPAPLDIIVFFRDRV